MRVVIDVVSREVVASVGGVVPIVEGWLRWGASGDEARDGALDAEGVEDSAGDVAVGDEGDDATAATALAGEDVLGEDATEEVSPRQPGWASSSRADRRMGAGLLGRGVGGVGRRSSDDGGAQFRARGEDASIAHEVASWRREDSGEARRGRGQSLSGPKTLSGDP